MRRFKKTVAIDFDGVLHQHISPWTVAHEIHDGPVPGAFEFLEQVLDEFNVVIFSARAADLAGASAIQAWLVKHWSEHRSSHGASDRELFNGRIEITAQKPHAFIYIDDRGWHFEGTFPTMDELRSFESWTKKTKVEAPPAKKPEYDDGSPVSYCDLQGCTFGYGHSGPHSWTVR